MSERVQLTIDNQVATVRMSRPEKRNALDVAALSHQVGGRIGVGAADDVLLDDRALVQVDGGVVGGRAD